MHIYIYAFQTQHFSCFNVVRIFHAEIRKMFASIKFSGFLSWFARKGILKVIWCIFNRWLPRQCVMFESILLFKTMQKELTFEIVEAL